VCEKCGLALRQTTRSLITLVEAQTGKQVVVQDEPSLQTHATVRIARGDAPAHVIRYKPIPGEEPDYLICFQCGFVLRKFDLPPNERFDFGSNSVGTSIVARLIKNAMGKKSQLDPERLTAAAQQILDGLLIHLLSTPVGLRICRWLREDYPDLIPLQERQVMRELTTNEATNTPDVKRRIPRKVFDATQAINAAHAIAWADILGQPQLTRPFTDHLRDGQALVDLLEDLPAQPRYDRELIDAWGEHLKLTEWYQWVATS
jgi:hypothetical protein